MYVIAISKGCEKYMDACSLEYFGLLGRGMSSNLVCPKPTPTPFQLYASPWMFHERKMFYHFDVTCVLHQC